MPANKKELELTEISFILDETRVQIHFLASAEQRKLLNAFDRKTATAEFAPQAFQVMTVQDDKPGTATELVKTIRDAIVMNTDENEWNSLEQMAAQVDARAQRPGAASTSMMVEFIWNTDSEDDNLFGQSMLVDVSDRAGKTLVNRFNDALEAIGEDDFYDFGASIDSDRAGTLKQLTELLVKEKDENLKELKAVITRVVALNEPVREPAKPAARKVARR